MMKNYCPFTIIVFNRGQTMNETSVQYGKQWAKKIESKVTSRMQQDTVPYTETPWPIPRHLALHWDSKTFTEIHQKYCPTNLNTICCKLHVQKMKYYKIVTSA